MGHPAILNRIAKQWLETRKQHDGDDEAEQARLHAEAAKWCGSISGGDPHGSEKVRETVRNAAKKSQCTLSGTLTQAREAWVGHPASKDHDTVNCPALARNRLERAPHVKSYFDDTNRLTGPPAHPPSD